MGKIFRIRPRKTRSVCTNLSLLAIVPREESRGASTSVQNPSDAGDRDSAGLRRPAPVGLLLLRVECEIAELRDRLRQTTRYDHHFVDGRVVETKALPGYEPD